MIASNRKFSIFHFKFKTFTRNSMKTNSQTICKQIIVNAVMSFDSYLNFCVDIFGFYQNNGIPVSKIQEFAYEKKNKIK